MSMVKTTVKTVLFGQYHSATINSIPVLLLLALAFWKKAPYRFQALGLMIVVVVVAAFASFYDMIAAPLSKYIHILISFQFDRVTFLIPISLTLIMLLLTQTEFLSRKVLYPIIIVYSLLQVYTNYDLSYNWMRLAKSDFFQKKKLTTFASFYSTDLFAQIDHHINKPKNTYRVVSVGLNPSVALYNGFYTLDAYQNHYPLAYKRKFRKIIAGELDKSAHLKDYFDHWGSRCYVFSADLENSCAYDCRKDAQTGVNLSIDTGALKDMGGAYIFSAVPILNAESLHIVQEQVFEDNVSSYKIHLYKL
jgi:hypothetical protein